MSATSSSTTSACGTASRSRRPTVPTEQKIAWIEALDAAGVDIIQVGSFVHQEKVPQMADTDDLFAPLRAAGPQARARPPLGARPQREGDGARLRVRRRLLLHGRVGERHAQPEEHRDGHRGGLDTHHRDGEGGARCRRDGAGVGPVRIRLRLRGRRARGARPRDRPPLPRREACPPSASRTPRATRHPTRWSACSRRSPLSTRASSARATCTTRTGSGWRTRTRRCGWA